MKKTGCKFEMVFGSEDWEILNNYALQKETNIENLLTEKFFELLSKIKPAFDPKFKMVQEKMDELIERDLDGLYEAYTGQGGESSKRGKYHLCSRC